MKKKLLPFFVVLFISLTSSIQCADKPIDDVLYKKLTFEDRAILFSGNANPALAQSVAQFLNVELGEAKVSQFNDKEIQIHINQNVRSKDVFILQSTCFTKNQSVNDTFMELYLMIRTMKRGGANSITAIIPYYGYARQDRQTSSLEPISAADVAYMLEMAGIDRVITIDLHCGQIQGFFQNASVENLYAGVLFAEYFSKKNLKNMVVVSPDAGGMARANKFSDNLASYGISAPTVAIIKHRKEAGVIDSMRLLGNVEGANAIIIDDVCDTGSTLIKAAQLLKQHGAKKVFVAVTHPVFSGSALEKISSSTIDEIVVTDTIPLQKEPSPNLNCISVAPLLGKAIADIYNQMN